MRGRVEHYKQIQETPTTTDSWSRIVSNGNARRMFCVFQVTCSTRNIMKEAPLKREKTIQLSRQLGFRENPTEVGIVWRYYYTLISLTPLSYRVAVVQVMSGHSVVFQRWKLLLRTEIKPAPPPPPVFRVVWQDIRSSALFHSNHKKKKEKETCKEQKGKELYSTILLEMRHAFYYCGCCGGSWRALAHTNELQLQVDAQLN